MPEVPITARPHVFYIRPAPGWLEVLLEEVTGIVETPMQKYKFEPKITLLKGTVKVHRCDWRQGLEILLRLTTAHDVEWMILESKCTKWSEVDAILSRVPWKAVLSSREIPVHVSADVRNGFSSSSGKLRENLCKIAGVTHVSEGGEMRFKIELRGEHLRISVSLSGEPLYKRGYKAKLTAVAPLAEHQAAAAIRWVLAGVQDEKNIGSVFVPFAGSGTFGFESQVVLSGSGPGAFSRSFACDHFPCTPPATMKFLRKKLEELLVKNPLPCVVFNDFNKEAIKGLRENVSQFSHPENFEIIEDDVFQVPFKFKEGGKILVLLNPPYGNRLSKDSSIDSLYARLGSYMLEASKTYKSRIAGGCLCPDETSWRKFLKELQSPLAETHHFTHGGKEMRLVRWYA